MENISTENINNTFVLKSEGLNMIKIDSRFEIIYEGREPYKATPYSDFDVYAEKIEKIREDFYKVTVCKIQSKNPNFRILVIPRSSIIKTKWILHNSVGNIDSDYTGNVSFFFSCLPTITKKKFLGLIPYNKISYEKFPYEIGDRVGQIFLSERIDTKMVSDSLISRSERNENGFGSTGK